MRYVVSIDLQIDVVIDAIAPGIAEIDSMARVRDYTALFNKFPEIMDIKLHHSRVDDLLTKEVRSGRERLNEATDTQ